MKERIALCELNADLTNFTAGVHNFAARLKSTAEDVRDKHAASLKALDGKLSTAVTQKSAAEISAEQLRQRLTKESKYLAALNEEVEAAEAVCSALPAEIQDIKDSLDRDTNDLRRQEAALANQESIQESKLRAVRQAVDTYRGRLGLEFRKGERDEMVLVFTHLDASDHQREFQLGVIVAADNKYTVTRCTPVLENLEPVLEKLNQGGDDFRGFVRRVRKLFLALV